MKGFVVFLSLLIVILNITTLSIAENSDVVKKQQETSYQHVLNPSIWEKIASGSQAIIAIFTIFLARFAPLQIRINSRYRRYDYLANLYYKLFEIGIKYPDFINEDKTKDYRTSFSGDEKIQYNAYAHMVWGHAEDIFDRTKSKKYADLLMIFESTIKRYHKLHSTWYEDNKSIFTMPGFDDFVKKYDP